MKAITAKIIRLRNPVFRLDDAVSSQMLISFSVNQFIALMRGCLLWFRGRNPRRMLRGSHVKFFYLNGIRWGRYLKLGDHVFISALGCGGISLGNNVGIGAFSRLIICTSLGNLGRSIRIGNNVGIGEYAYLGGAGGLEIGDDCIIGQYFSCHPENHIYSDLSTPIRLQGTTRKGISIGNNCWIGSKVTVLDGVTIGDGCVIAAGAVVASSFPSNVVIGGVPARIIKNRAS